MEKSPFGLCWRVNWPRSARTAYSCGEIKLLDAQSQSDENIVVHFWEQNLLSRTDHKVGGISRHVQIKGLNTIFERGNGVPPSCDHFCKISLSDLASIENRLSSAFASANQLVL